MKYFIIVVWSGLFLFGCDHNSVNPTEGTKSYFSLNIGNKWNYRYKLISGSGSLNWTQESGEMTWSLKSKENPSRTKNFYTMNCKRQGLKIIATYDWNTNRQTLDTLATNWENNFKILVENNRLQFLDDDLGLADFTNANLVYFSCPDTSADTLKIKDSRSLGQRVSHMTLLKDVGLYERNDSQYSTFLPSFVIVALIKFEAAAPIP